MRNFTFENLNYLFFFINGLVCFCFLSDQHKAYKPLVVFIHHSDPESCIFKNLFGINCVSPNVICLVGHVDGKLLWSLCDSSNQFQASHELQALFNLKQPIVGIFFTKNIKGLEGYYHYKYWYFPCSYLHYWLLMYLVPLIIYFIFVLIVCFRSETFFF